MISDFRGEYAFLSNFADSPLYYKGLKFANAEAAFQAQKATDLQTKESFCSMRAIVAKKTGKKIKEVGVNIVGKILVKVRTALRITELLATDLRKM